MILHILQKSPYQSNTLDQCLKNTKQSDGILLIQDGVYAVNHQDILQSSLDIYVIKDDLTARGLDNKNAAIRSIDYDKFVDLCAHYDSSISW